MASRPGSPSEPAGSVCGVSARRWIGLFGVSLILAVLVSPAHAAGASTRTDQDLQPHPVCTVQDDRLAELSGLAVGGGEWFAVSDGGARLEVFVLGRDCAIQRVITNPTNPYDVEDLARADDGTLWLGDTGDNSGLRETVALHALRPNGQSTLYRLTYPRDPYNAEALVVDADGTPYIFTKTVLGSSGIYRPAAELVSPGPTSLEKVGTVHVQATDTPGGPVRAVSSLMVTAAAFNQDHTVLAVRTYTDVYLYPAPEGDVAEAITHEPVRIPLPNAPQGEAVAFTADGTLLAASEGVGEPIRAIPHAATQVSTGSGTQHSAAGAASQPATTPDSGGDGGLPTIPAVAVAVVLAGAVVFGLSRLRRQP